jgi:hypothetical protein
MIFSNNFIRIEIKNFSFKFQFSDLEYEFLNSNKNFQIKNMKKNHTGNISLKQF